MAFSILIPFYNLEPYRENAVKQVLRFYLEHIPAESMVYLVEQRSKTDFSEFSGPQFVYLEHNVGTAPFNKASAWNYGMKQIMKDGFNEFTLMLDADILIEPRYLEKHVLLPYFETHDMIHPFVAIHDLQRYETNDFVKKWTTDLPIEANRLRNGYRCYGGALFIRNSTYADVGGFDERFDAWGHEDDVFYYLVRRHVGSVRAVRLPALIFHLYHPPLNTRDYVYGAKYRELALIKNRCLYQIIRSGRAGLEKYIKSNRIRNGFFSRRAI